MTDFQDHKDVLPLLDLFLAMMSVDGSRAYLLGRDGWRTDITDAAGGKVDSLEIFDSSLARETSRQAKTKGGKWSNPKEWNLWPAVHNGLLLPTLGQVLGRYGDTDISLSYAEAVQFFTPLSYAIRHGREYEEMKAEYHYEGKEEKQIKKEWDDRLAGYFTHVDVTAPLPEIVSVLPEPLRGKVIAASKHRDDPKPENDSLIGRIICAYLAAKGVPWQKFCMNPHIEDYLRPLRDAPAGYKVMPLYERLMDMHVESMPQLMKDLPILDYNADTRISISDFFRMYRWYGTGKVVEMIKPDLVGAGLLSFYELAAFFELMEKKHGLDYHNKALMTDGANLFRNTQSLQMIGRLTLIQDIIESAYTVERMDGEPLRRLARLLWSDDERQAAWGNASRYVPESRGDLRDYSIFKSDIGNIIYSAGLFEERNGQQERGASLKKLAFKTKGAENFLQSLGDIIRDNAGLINDWAAQWEQRYPGSERARIAWFVQLTFGLAQVKPVAVRMDEISLGFEESGYDADKRAYHIKYREAKDTIEMNIPLPGNSFKGTVTYKTATENSLPMLEVKHSNGTQINIPVPSRGSYDPYGATGSPHGGEIIGFGCSVHHSSLAVMLAELAGLGADRATLHGVADKLMFINPGIHQRKALAGFQVEQIWAAFDEGRVFSYAEFLETDPVIREELLLQPGHEHTVEYLSSPRKEPLAASATRAMLYYGYENLYPHDTEKAAKIGARDCWYFVDVDAKLATTGKPMKWHAVQG